MIGKKKKSVFISSTYKDLKSYRRGVWNKLEKYDAIIRGMEKFGAQPTKPLETCLKEVEESDIFICLIAFKYGTIDKETGKSITRLEYERAVGLEKDIYVYFKDEKYPNMSKQDMDIGDNYEKLEEFKKTLKEQHTIDKFTTEADLEDKIDKLFSDLFNSKQEEKKGEIDEYKKYKALIEKFLILPGFYYRREIKLKVNFGGTPFPASKAICESFNLPYGKTLGIKIEIIKPEIKKNVFDFIFVCEPNIEEFFKKKIEKEIEVYCNMLFFEDKVERFEASFIRETRMKYSENIIASSPFFEEEEIEAEGTIVLLLSKFVT